MPCMCVTLVSMHKIKMKVWKNYFQTSNIWVVHFKWNYLLTEIESSFFPETSFLETFMSCLIWKLLNFRVFHLLHALHKCMYQRPSSPTGFHSFGFLNPNSVKWCEAENYFSKKNSGREWRIGGILQVDTEDDLPEWWPVNVFTFIVLFGLAKERGNKEERHHWLN